MGECGDRRIPSFIMVSCAMFTKVFTVQINYLKLSCFLLYPLTVWRHIFTGCSQGGKVTSGNMLCTFKYKLSQSVLWESLFSVGTVPVPLPPAVLPPEPGDTPPPDGRAQPPPAVAVPPVPKSLTPFIRPRNILWANYEERNVATQKKNSSILNSNVHDIRFIQGTLLGSVVLSCNAKFTLKLTRCFCRSCSCTISCRWRSRSSSLAFATMLLNMASVTVGFLSHSLTHKGKYSTEVYYYYTWDLTTGYLTTCTVVHVTSTQWSSAY